MAGAMATFAKTAARLPRIGILFAQFAAYHIDRIEAAALRLQGRVEIIAVEVASASATYAWAPSGAVRGAAKRVLFNGEPYERIGRMRRFRAQYAALKDCDTVFVGIGYNEPDVLVLALALRLRGRRVVLMSESKRDDFPRLCGANAVRRCCSRCFPPRWWAARATWNICARWDLGGGKWSRVMIASALLGSARWAGSRRLRHKTDRSCSSDVLWRRRTSCS